MDPFSPIAQSQLAEFDVIRDQMENSSTNTGIGQGNNNGGKIVFIIYIYIYFYNVSKPFPANDLFVQTYF